MLTRRLLSGIVILLTACSPFPASKIEPPKLPEQYLAAEAMGGVVLPDRWWESFHDPQLNSLQQQLFAGNLDLRQALYRLQQLDALQRSSAASLWPSLGLNGSLSRDHTPGISGSTTATNHQVSLAAGYEIDLWKRLNNRDQATQLRRQAGRNEVQTLQLSLSAQLADQYFLAAEQRAQLQLGEQQVDSYRQLVDILNDRYRVGLADTGELYQARQNLAMAEARLPNFRANLRQAENSIALLLGQPPQLQTIGGDQLPRLNTVIASGLPASLLVKRPDISAALLQVQAADHDLAAALAERLPAVNLTATLGHSASQAAFGNIEGSFWSLALGLTQPLIDGGRRRAEADRQQALREEKLAAYQQAILAAIQEVETALSNDENSARRQQLLEQQLQAGRQEVLLARDNYRSGLIDSSSLLASELRYYEINSQLLTNRRQWLSHRITLARALGGSWMAEELDRQMQILSRQQD